MGVLDILAKVVKDNEAKKAYGTPYYQQKLGQLAAEQEGRTIGNSQAAFNLEEDQAMAPIRREVQQSLVPGREAAARLAGAKADNAEFENSPEMRGLKQQRAELALQIMTNKDARAQAMLKPQLDKIDAQIAHLNRPPAPPRQSFSTVNTTDADGNPIQMRVETHDPEGKLLGFNTGGAAPGPIAPKTTVQEQANHQYFSSSLKALDELDRSIDAFAKASGPQAKAEALRSYQAQLALIGNILGKASGDQRVGDKERPVYSQIAGETSTWVNLYDPTIAKRRTAEARKFLTQIAPARNPHGVGTKPTANDPLSTALDEFIGRKR